MWEVQRDSMSTTEIAAATIRTAAEGQSGDSDGRSSQRQIVRRDQKTTVPAALW